MMILRGRGSLLRHPGLGQTGEKDPFEPVTERRRIEIPVGPDAYDGRITIRSEHPVSLGEFGGGKLQLAFEAIGGSKEVMRGLAPGSAWRAFSRQGIAWPVRD